MPPKPASKLSVRGAAKSPGEDAAQPTSTTTLKNGKRAPNDQSPLTAGDDSDSGVDDSESDDDDEGSDGCGDRPRGGSTSSLAGFPTDSDNDSDAGDTHGRGRRGGKMSSKKQHALIHEFATFKAIQAKAAKKRKKKAARKGKG